MKFTWNCDILSTLQNNQLATLFLHFTFILYLYISHNYSSLSALERFLQKAKKWRTRVKACGVERLFHILLFPLFSSNMWTLFKNRLLYTDIVAGDGKGKEGGKGGGQKERRKEGRAGEKLNPIQNGLCESTRKSVYKITTGGALQRRRAPPPYHLFWHHCQLNRLIKIHFCHGPWGKVGKKYEVWRLGRFSLHFFFLKRVTWNHLDT